MGKRDEYVQCAHCDERAQYRTLRRRDPEQVAKGVRKPDLVPWMNVYLCDNCDFADENLAPRSPYGD